MTEPNPNPTPTPEPPATPPTPPAPETPPESTPAPTSPDPGGSGGLSPEAMKAELAEARREAAKYRTERNTYNTQLDEFKKGIAKALGIGDEGEPDPNQLQSELQTVQSNYRQERLQNLVLNGSLKQGADPQLTFPYLLTNGQLSGIDISSADAAQQVSDAITAAVEAYPKLKADFGTQPPAQQQVNVGGGSNPPGGGSEPPLPDKNPWSKETFNLTEQWKIMQADSQLADRLRRAATA